MAEDVEVLLQVRITIRIIGAEPVVGQVGFRGIVELRCQGVSGRVASGGIAAPPTGFHPMLTVSCSIDMNGNQYHLIAPETLADLIDSPASLGEGDVFALGHKEPGIEAQGGELLPDAEGEVAVVCVFTEKAVRAAFAGRVEAVAVVEKDDHDCRL